jgi:hypothetical protein
LYLKAASEEQCEEARNLREAFVPLDTLISEHQLTLSEYSIAPPKQMSSEAYKSIHLA